MSYSRRGKNRRRLNFVHCRYSKERNPCHLLSMLLLGMLCQEVVLFEVLCPTVLLVGVYEVLLLEGLAIRCSVLEKYRALT